MGRAAPAGPVEAWLVDAWPVASALEGAREAAPDMEGCSAELEVD